MTTRRLLIVSPHFPPVNAPDMQRVRMLLPFFQEHNWQVDVLAVVPEKVAAPHDPWLEDGLPQDVMVHRVEALGLGWSRVPGLGGLGLRAFHALANAGDRLLAQGVFDLVYFSTTVFEVHLLGPRWKRKFGVPFVMDYQDPWVTDYYHEHPDVVPPGGRIKYSLIDMLHRWMEPRVLNFCSGITSVSPDYPKQLGKRYPWLVNFRCLVQPFPAAGKDFDRLPEFYANERYFDPDDGYIHWVYIGVVIPGMFPVLRSFFRTISRECPPELRERLKLHFIGTSYAPPGRAVPMVLPLAAEYGLSDQVHEQTARIPYADALKCLVDADALLAFGSDDPGYTASKIYPYLLAAKPLLAIYHEKSSVVSLIRKVGGAVCISFSIPIDSEDLAKKISELWIDKNVFENPLDLNEVNFKPYTDRGCAEVLCSFFEECLSNA